MPESLIPKHGGYQKLKTFQLAQVIYDITTRFCAPNTGPPGGPSEPKGK